MSTSDGFQRSVIRYRRLGGGYRRADVEFALAELRETLRRLDDDLVALRDRNRELEIELAAALSEAQALRAKEHEISQKKAAAARAAAEIEETANARGREIVGQAEEAAMRIGAQASRRVADADAEVDDLVRMKEQHAGDGADDGRGARRGDRPGRARRAALHRRAGRGRRRPSAGNASGSAGPPTPSRSPRHRFPPTRTGQPAGRRRRLGPRRRKPAAARRAGRAAAPNGEEKQDEEEFATVFETRVELEAGPFLGFAALSAFERELEKLPGVEDVYVRRFGAERAVIEVTTGEPGPLLRTMREQLSYGLEVRSARPSSIVFDVSPRPGRHPLSARAAGRVPLRALAAVRADGSGPLPSPERLACIRHNAQMATTENGHGTGGSPERGELFTTISGLPVDGVYSPVSVDVGYGELGGPGEFPFTRGVYRSMYRGRLWTMRQFAGFGTAEETNARFRYLLEQGQTGLSVAFDMPTLMGYDSDHPRALGEVGREGVAVDSVGDVERLFAGIPLGGVSTSMTINSPAAVLLAFYVAVGDAQGVDRSELRGTIQTDILKEYIAQKEFIFPPEPSLRLVVDMIEFCARELPRMHPVSISGYHIREAGSTAAQELAFTLADGFAYVDAALERGLAVDEFAPRLSFFFNAHIDFFEEVAKYRAARRIWARELRDRYRAKDPRSWLMRFHAQTAGVSLTAQQPQVNIVRTAIEALAAVLGGTQSLHTNSFDEALALPTEEAARLALRTQQVIAHETGVTRTATRSAVPGSWRI